MRTVADRPPVEGWDVVPDAELVTLDGLRRARRRLAGPQRPAAPRVGPGTPARRAALDGSHRTPARVAPRPSPRRRAVAARRRRGPAAASLPADASAGRSRSSGGRRVRRRGHGRLGAPLAQPGGELVAPPRWPSSAGAGAVAARACGRHREPAPSSRSVDGRVLGLEQVGEQGRRGVGSAAPRRSPVEQARDALAAAPDEGRPRRRRPSAADGAAAASGAGGRQRAAARAAPGRAAKGRVGVGGGRGAGSAGARRGAR